MMRDSPKPRPGVSPASSPAARKRMLAAKGRDTKVELRVRSHLYRLGLRRKADIVFGGEYFGMLTTTPFRGSDRIALPLGDNVPVIPLTSQGVHL